MTTGGATPISTTGSPRFGGVSAHRRRADLSIVTDTININPMGHQHQHQNINDCIAEAAVDCFGSCNTANITNNFVLHRKGSVEIRNYGKLGKNFRCTLLGFFIALVGFSVFVKFSYMAGGGPMAEMEAEAVSRSWSNAHMLILRDYKSDVMMKTQRVLAADFHSFEISSSLPKRVLDNKSQLDNHVSEIWMKPNSSRYHQCITRPRDQSILFSREWLPDDRVSSRPC